MSHLQILFLDEATEFGEDVFAWTCCEMNSGNDLLEDMSCDTLFSIMNVSV